MLGYAEDSGAWRPPFNWRRAMKLKTSNMLTAEEQTTIQRVELFSVDTLRQLWNSANERQRLYMLLCLNCGMGAKEIATLRRQSCHLESADAPTNGRAIGGSRTFAIDGGSYIERPRNKTRVPGRWPLWDETARLLRRHFAPADKGANPNGYALLGYNGQGLSRVMPSGTGKFDEVGDKFDKLREVVKEKYELDKLPLSFYALRRTAYSWIKENFGTEVAETFSQHKEKGMIVNYSNPLFDKVAEAVKAMRENFMVEVFRDCLKAEIHEHLDPIDTSGQ
jgi:integrase